MPCSLIASLSELFQNNEVALGVHSDEAKAAGKRFVLGHGEVFVGHSLGQAWGLGLVIVDDRLFNVNIDLLLCAIGGGHKAVQTRQVQEKTHQTNATCSAFDTDQMETNHEAM